MSIKKWVYFRDSLKRLVNKNGGKADNGSGQETPIKSRLVSVYNRLSKHTHYAAIGEILAGAGGLTKSLIKHGVRETVDGMVAKFDPHTNMDMRGGDVDMNVKMNLMLQRLEESERRRKVMEAVLHSHGYKIDETYHLLGYHMGVPPPKPHIAPSPHPSPAHVAPDADAAPPPPPDAPLPLPPDATHVLDDYIDPGFGPFGSLSVLGSFQFSWGMNV